MKKCPHCGVSVDLIHSCRVYGGLVREDDIPSIGSDFVTSAVIGAVTDSALLGGLLGGDFVGGVVGDFLNGGDLWD